MEIRQVEYVVAIVDHGGFTRAAAALHVAQPSLSQGVRRLEAQLGAPLFVRQGRGVRLSPAGEAFLGPARRMLRDAATARDAVAQHADVVTGRLDVVALPTLVASPLAQLLGAFRSRFPGVTVRVADPAGPADLVAMVRDGRCEVGLTEIDGPVEGLDVVEVGVQRLVVVLPPGVEVADGAIPLEHLADHPLILAPAGTATRDLVERALADLGADAQVAVETSQREAIVPLVLAGAGATILPEPMADDARRRGAVVRPTRPGLRRSIGLVHPPDDLSPAARALLRLAA